MVESYKLFFSNKKLVISSLIAIAMFFFSAFINAKTSLYANESESNSVTDIVLSNTRVYDVERFYIYGMLLFSIFIIVWCLRHPWQIPYIMKSIATFVLIRSLFMSLTHIGTFPDKIAINNDGFMGQIDYGGDLFFSGHTGLPFLMGLVFRNHKPIRYTFIGLSVFFGIIVLLGHIHYSIDVLGAFFITYTIYHICERLRKTDRIYFKSIHSIIHPIIK